MLEVAVEADSEWDSKAGWEALARKAAEAAIAESAFPQLTTSQRPVELSVRLAGNEEVRSLNAEWRGSDKPTNVLSFPMVEALAIADVAADGPELMLGDIVLAHGVCQAEAAEKAIPLDRHAAHLMVHGTLHLLGYDHHDDASAADMEGREVRALARLGIADPYRQLN
ncbi:MAG: rRNA maturation RNase YbeY [Sphingomicrobium sp.]